MRQRLSAETGPHATLGHQRHGAAAFPWRALLRDNDVASMAASLEQRVPLVDQSLRER